MIWQIILGILEVARILARFIANRDAEQSAKAKILLNQLDNINALIAKADEARDRVRADIDAGGVRAPDKHSRD